MLATTAGPLEFRAHVSAFRSPSSFEARGAAGRDSANFHPQRHALDAPWHYHPTMDNGKPAMTIDQVPLDWCTGPGVKLDFRHFSDGYVCTAADVEAELARIGHELKPGDIVLVNTRAGSRYGQDDYVSAGCGMGREATLWLTARGMRVCGTDAWTRWRTAPLMAQMKAHRRDGATTRCSGEGHKAGAETALLPHRKARAISKPCHQQGSK